MTTFEVTEDHHKLLQRMYWEWDDGGYDGAPAVGQKRPYGNSDVIGDVAEILGWELFIDRYGEENMTDEQGKLALKLHREMDTVLQILTSTLSIPLGVYEKNDRYDARSWKKVSSG